MRGQSGGKLKKISGKSKNFKRFKGLIVTKMVLIATAETAVISFKPIMATVSLIATTLNCHNKS